MIRGEVERLPTSAAAYYRRGVDPAPPRFPAGRALEPLPGRLPPRLRHAPGDRPAGGRRALPRGGARGGPGDDLRRGSGRRALRGLHRQQPRAHRRTRPPAASKRPGSILYREGIAKISQFSRCCNDDGIPIVWLQDISGFDIGAEAEKQGLLGYGSSLIYTNSTNTVPDDHGAAAQGLRRGLLRHGRHALRPGGAARDADLTAGGDGGANARDRRLQHQARRQLRDRRRDRGRAREDPQRDGGRRGAHHRRHGSDQGGPPDGHRRGRAGRTRSVRISRCWWKPYQGYGYRRVKNPRIWSLHDIAILGEGGR